jgi:hypothetical protein
MNPSPFPFYIGFPQVGEKLSLYKNWVHDSNGIEVFGNWGWAIPTLKGKNCPFIKTLRHQC